MNASDVKTKNYEQKTVNYEPTKQTQSNPIFGHLPKRRHTNREARTTNHSIFCQFGVAVWYNSHLCTLRNMSKYKAILFDLDGTLLDTLQDLADAGNAALRELGCPAHSTEDYKYFIGKGVEELVRQILPENNRDKQTVAKCLSLMKRNYSQFWKRNSKPYPGIAELLTELEKRGIVKVVFSNKLDEFTGVMVRELLPKWKFEIIRGALPNVPIKPDPAAALRIAASPLNAL